MLRRFRKASSNSRLPLFARSKSGGKTRRRFRGGGRTTRGLHAPKTPKEEVEGGFS